LTFSGNSYKPKSGIFPDFADLISTLDKDTALQQ
jgi:hypothetical protein